MLTNEEYKALKEKEMRQAEEIMANIRACRDKYIRYTDKRPITDVRQMMCSSAELYPDSPAFFAKESKGAPYKKITYKEAMDDINGLGTSLLEGGLKGKRIAVIGENSYRWAISYLAVICGVGIVVPLDKELSKDSLKELITEAEVSCVIFSGKYADIFTEMKESGETQLQVLVNMNLASSEKGVLALDELIYAGKQLICKGETAYLDARIMRDEMSVLLFTSGTTGSSKGVMLSHGNIVEDLMAAPTGYEVKTSDVFFSVLPLHHTYECTCGFLMPLYSGASIAYCEGLKYIVKNLQEAKPTIFLGVPAIFENLYKKIWQNARKQGKDEKLKKAIKINNTLKKIGIDMGSVFFKDIRALFGGRMRSVISGGAAINPEVLNGIRDFGINALQGYGLTECAPMGALNPDTAPRANSVGRAFPGFDARIDSPNEEGIGEICLKGGNVMLGYYKNPEATAEVIKDGWFYTGDLGYMDSEGFIYITGRKKNVIITKNGKNVYPEELEYYLGNIPYVAESMVFSTDSEDGEDTTIVASVYPDMEEVREKLGGSCTDDMIFKLLWSEVDKVNANQPFFKKIKKLIVRKEAFEKNTSNKIIRFAEGNKR
ncbi:MAG: AMP-binding protein [Clostridia bacterium]|nr:AMP-binding protein [Clostridia bacterium]